MVRGRGSRTVDSRRTGDDRAVARRMSRRLDRHERRWSRRMPPSGFQGGVRLLGTRYETGSGAVRRHAALAEKSSALFARTSRIRYGAFCIGFGLPAGPGRFESDHNAHADAFADTSEREKMKVSLLLAMGAPLHPKSLLLVTGLLVQPASSRVLALLILLAFVNRDPSHPLAF